MAFPDAVEDFLQRRARRLSQVAGGRVPLTAVDLRRVLADAVADAGVRMIDATWVPSSYVVQLNPADAAALIALLPSYRQELEEWAEKEYALPRYRHDAPIAVDLEACAEVKPRGAKAFALYQPADNNRQPGPTASKSVPVRARRLRICHPDGRTDDYDIRSSRTRIGRERGNEVWLTPETVSREHAHIICDDAVCLIVDHSTNGTRVNGEPVRLATLEHGDEILIGGVRLTFLDGPADPPDRRRPRPWRRRARPVRSPRRRRHAA